MTMHMICHIPDELERSVTQLQSRLSKRDALVAELENQVRSDQLRYCKENANYRRKTQTLQDKCNVSGKGRWKVEKNDACR